MAMIISVPARILLFGLNINLLILQFLVAVSFLFISIFIWNKGLIKYESASS